MAGLYARTYWRISLAGGALVLAFAGILLATFDLSLTWLVLIDGGLAFVALTFLSGRPLAVLFSCLSVSASSSYSRRDATPMRMAIRIRPIVGPRKN